MQVVEVFDTTLRDGLQVEGVSASVDDKLRIAEQLDLLGVHFIEGGWPGANPKDIEFFREAKKLKFKHAKLAAFGSTRRADTPVEKDHQVRLLTDNLKGVQTRTAHPMSIGPFTMVDRRMRL